MCPSEVQGQAGLSPTGSPLLSCVLLVELGGMSPKAAQTASGEYHGACIPCPLCLWPGLASADTGKKTHCTDEFPFFLNLREFHWIFARYILQLSMYIHNRSANF